jgi:probable F420-dependent oxidoreductase
VTADLATDRARIRTAIGPWGAWSFGFAYAPAAAMRTAAQAIEATGYGCLWYPETLDSHEAYTNAGTLLAATEHLRVATGIASIWSRDARASVQAARTLADASGDRFILGLGVSHRPLITSRGHVYEKPVATMRGYLDAMEQADDAVPLGDDQPPIHIVLAGLRPPMLRLAAERSLGAHPYLVTVDHTRRAREVMGPEALLLVEHKVVLESDPDIARAKARAEIEWYLSAEHYVKNLLWLGFTEDDVANGGSDRLVDELVFWGDEDAIAERLRAHHAAGADHVAIHPVRDEHDPLGVETFARLAAHLA